MSNRQSLPVSFPPIAYPIIDQATGGMSVFWYRALLGMFDRTGGLSGQTSDTTSSLLAQDAFEAAINAQQQANLAFTLSQQATSQAETAERDVALATSSMQGLSDEVIALESGVLYARNNLADLSDKAKARSNLGLLSDDDSYVNPAYPALVTERKALDYLLYTPPAITGFSNTVNTVEIGQTISAVGFAWAVNKPISSLKFNGLTLAPTTVSYSLNGLSLTASTSYTLLCGDGTNTAARTTAVTFAAKRWWGTSANAALSSADIIALGNAEFAGSRGQSRTFSATDAYLYIAYPTSFGSAAFVVNGLQSAGWVQATVSHVNQSGYTQPYYTYRSQYPQNGSGIQVVVS